MQEISTPSPPNNTKTKEEYQLIFLPGLHGTDQLYDDLIKQIRQHELNFKSIRIAYPSHLTQGYDTLLQWLSSQLETHIKMPCQDNSTQVIKTIIIAESFSSPLAIRLIPLFPNKIHALIIGGGFINSPVHSVFSILPALLLRPLFMLAPPRLATRYFLTGLESSPTIVEKVRNVVKKVSSKNLSQRIVSILTLRKHQASSIEETIKIPTLLLHAKQDILIREKAQNELQLLFPHAIAYWIKSPHLIFQCHPRTCALSILTFLNAI